MKNLKLVKWQTHYMDFTIITFIALRAGKTLQTQSLFGVMLLAKTSESTICLLKFLESQI